MGSKKSKKEKAKLAKLLNDSKNNSCYPPLQQPKDDNDYLSISFQHLQEDYDLDRTSLSKEYKLQLLKKIVAITHMTWNDLNLMDKKHGFERINKDAIGKLPAIITEDVKKLYVLRFASQNCRLVGIRQNNIFQVFFIDSDLSLYDH